MKYIKSDKDFFINPYNFVSVNLKETKHFNMEEMNQEEPGQETSELQTGYLVCRMKCRTPLAIPDTANKKETDCEGHFKYHFMGMKEETLQGAEGKLQTELTGTPLIPGSSIRGVIRNVYETITDSCFGTMRADTSVTIRSNTPFEPGLLIIEGKTWKLYAATRHKIVSDAKYYNSHKMADKGIERFDLRQWKDKSGMQVWFQTTVYQQKKDKKKECVKFFRTVEGEGLKTGYLCIGEQNPNRHFHGIFTKKGTDAIRNVTEKEIKRLEDTLLVYQNSKINKLYPDEHSGYETYWHMKYNGVIPVYYKIGDGKEKQNENSSSVLNLSFAALGRKTFEKTLNEKAGQKSHHICNDRNNLCAACSLFGTIEGKGIGSKIRFTDAESTNFEKSKLKKDIIFKELSSPRISYVPFYLTSDKKNVNYRKGYDSDELQIRGRKFYWHHQPDIMPQEKIERTKRNGTFDVLDIGTEFEFKIYFDQITKKQLEILAIAVHLNENDMEGKRCHKIGHGKPLGYGSVKMTVEKCVIRKYDVQKGWKEEAQETLFRKISFSELFYKNWALSSSDFEDKELIHRCNKDTWDDLIKISNLYEIEETENKKIEYPGIISEGFSEEEKKKNPNQWANHQWFRKNYQMGNKNVEDLLPKISDCEQKLKKYKCMRTYKANIVSTGKKIKKSDIVIYDIMIQEDGELNGKNGVLHANEKEKFQIWQQIEVRLGDDDVFYLFKEEEKLRK